MKINRQVTIPFEINEKLKTEENASALISNLLEAYYNKTPEKKIDILEEILSKPLKEKIENEKKIFEKAVIEWKPTTMEKEEMKRLKLSFVDYFRSKIWRK